ncbi:hypothetical protein AB838_06210 [Rhodobacteraceae bacterium (ex Bugula neritina AB1)]|nr:hypothetical protein AB838_06210 [Rhodobacteraceae bacterium (ex Bugula neritina AB1)]
MHDLLSRVEAVVSMASGGAVSVEKLHAAKGDLISAGMDSMKILTVIMRLEAEFGVVIDMNEDASFLQNTATIAEFVQVQLALEVVA